VQDAVVVVEQNAVMLGKVWLRRSAWIPNDVGPPIAEWLRGQRLGERQRVNVLWVAQGPGKVI
jgi:hypothetical protein